MEADSGSGARAPEAGTQSGQVPGAPRRAAPQAAEGDAHLSRAPLFKSTIVSGSRVYTYNHSPESSEQSVAEEMFSLATAAP